MPTCLLIACLGGIIACRLSSLLSSPGIAEQAEQSQDPSGLLTTEATRSPALMPTSTPSQAAPETPSAGVTGEGEPLSTPTSLPSPAPTPIPFYRVIGRSVEGRPLEIYTFGNGADQRLIIAGIHGGYEWNTAALAEELITYLQVNPQVIAPEKTLFILPNLNPDGEARAHGPDGRANANGVDLNRNFPANWEKNYRRSGCWQERPVTAGLTPASEPETQAVIAFVKDNPGIRAAISYHSAALGIFPGGLPPDENSKNLAETLAAVSGYPYPPKDIGCIYTGEMVNWLATQGIPAVDIELTNHRDTDFEINLKVLEAFLSWQPPNP